ncbi:MAG TPA: hypothetical protein PLV45_02460 [bacterium]|nr:hypothetical protein [bacterium]
MKDKIVEQYTRDPDAAERFDLIFWQSQPPAAIFDAAYQMILDYLILKGHDVSQPGLQRTVEYFQR